MLRGIPLTPAERTLANNERIPLWTSANGETWTVERMSDTHLQNVDLWLRKHPLGSAARLFSRPVHEELIVRDLPRIDIVWPSDADSPRRPRYTVSEDWNV